MTVGTYGDFPWMATMYYAFDQDANLYFLSSPETLHCRQIAKNNKVGVAIADSQQKIGDKKKGLQMWGIAEQIRETNETKKAIQLWKDYLGVNKEIKGPMYKITPKRIKLFDQEMFKVDDGREPVLEL